MSALVPRWEWRGFGDELRDVESIFGPGSPSGCMESDEVYVLSAAGTDAVKVRDELMDVKHLLEVNDDGLEQWVPVMKAGFPAVRDRRRLGAPGAAAWMRHRRASPERRTRLRELLDEVVGPHPGPARGRGAQEAGAVHDRRLHGGS